MQHQTALSVCNVCQGHTFERYMSTGNEIMKNVFRVNQVTDVQREKEMTDAYALHPCTAMRQASTLARAAIPLLLFMSIALITLMVRQRATFAPITCSSTPTRPCHVLNAPLRFT